MAARGLGALVALATVLAGAVPAHPQHHGHSHTAGTPGDGHLRAPASPHQIQARRRPGPGVGHAVPPPPEAVVRDGRGFGMAFAADQEGYPGPLHVLELKDRLRLDPAQEARVRALLQRMFDEARPKGARLLDAEARLRRLFGAGGGGGGPARPPATAVRTAVTEVEQARTELRLVHLLAHLETHALLSEAQRRAYQEARWPGR